MHKNTEFGPAGGELQEQDLVNMLTRDFYLSYKFSQGDGESHIEIFKFLAAFYGQELGLDVVPVADLIERRRPKLSKLRQPKKHIQSGADEELIEITFDGDVDRFKEAVVCQEQPDNQLLIQKIMNSDIVFQTRPRYHSNDQHLSYFREYVIGRKPTGSQAFDSIFENLRDFYENGFSQDETNTGLLTALTENWQANHPGQDFFAGFTNQETEEPLAV